MSTTREEWDKSLIGDENVARREEKKKRKLNDGLASPYGERTLADGWSDREGERAS